MCGMHGAGIQVVAAMAAVWAAGLAGAAEAPDYSQGFAKLHALGLPSAKGATYVHLSAELYLQKGSDCHVPNHLARPGRQHDFDRVADPPGHRVGLRGMTR